MPALRRPASCDRIVGRPAAACFSAHAHTLDDPCTRDQGFPGPGPVHVPALLWPVALLATLLHPFAAPGAPDADCHRDEHRPGCAVRACRFLVRLGQPAVLRAQVHPVRRHRFRRPHVHRVSGRRGAHPPGGEPPPCHALGIAGAGVRGGLSEDRRADRRLRGGRAEGPRGLGHARPVVHLRHHRQLLGGESGAGGAPDRDAAQGAPGRAWAGARPADGAPARWLGRCSAAGAGDHALGLPRVARHVGNLGARSRRRDHPVRTPGDASAPRRLSARRCASASSSMWPNAWATPA